MKYIKEFNNNKIRNYEYIRERLIYVYDIVVTSDNLKSFEESSLYNDKLTDFDYVKQFVKWHMGFSEDEEIVKENGVAYANAGNVSGMGAVVTPTAGAVPGVPGEAGSGDIGSGWNQSIANNKNIRKRDNTLPRSRRMDRAKKIAKKMKTNNVPFDVRTNNTVDHKQIVGKKGTNMITKFSDFISKKA